MRLLATILEHVWGSKKEIEATRKTLAGVEISKKKKPEIPP